MSDLRDDLDSTMVESLGSVRIQAAGGWNGELIAAEYDAWKQAEQELIKAARTHLATL